MSRFARGIVLIGCVLAAALQTSVAASTALVPGGPAGSTDWTRVRSLRPGTPVRVSDAAGRSVKGALRTATDDEVVVVVGKAPVGIPRSSVRRVERMEWSRTARGALIGILAGAAVGVIQGALTVDTSKRVWLPSLAAGWGAIGAAVGAFDGSRRSRYVIVYMTP